MSTTTPEQRLRTIYTIRDAWGPAIAALVIALGAQLIGEHTLPLGEASIVFFPMVWGLVFAGFMSIQKWVPVGIDFQRVANIFVGVAVSFLIARLAFNIGPSLTLLVDAGPALLLQELGNVFGSLLLALPLAVLLRMGKATIGATFSLDREPSFAMVREKYGPDSDEFRGVLVMYVFGTLFGALYITLLVSLLVSLDWFDPLALAMGSGIGSGSMMAAGTGAIVAAYPEQAETIGGMAAIANLLATVGGVYLGIYISLPLAHRFYYFLTKKQMQHKAASDDDVDNKALREQLEETAAEATMSRWATFPITLVIGLGVAFIDAGEFSLTVVIGYLILCALVLVSDLLSWLTKHKVAQIVWVTTIGAYISSPWFFASDWLVEMVNGIDLLSIACMVLTVAGLSLGKDASMLKTVGWKIIPVGLVSITAAFIISTVIAEFTLGFWG